MEVTMFGFAWYEYPGLFPLGILLLFVIWCGGSVYYLDWKDNRNDDEEAGDEEEEAGDDD